MAGEAGRQPEPCTERCDEHYSLSRARTPHHGCRITDFVYKMLVLASRTPEPMQYLGAVPAGVLLGRLRRQDDNEEALAVTQRWWRGGEWGQGGTAGDSVEQFFGGRPVTMQRQFPAA